jgi:hypothetical protein
MQIQNTLASQSQPGLGAMVANNRTSLNATYADEVSTLKQDRVTLSNDYKSGDKAAIASDKTAISTLEATMNGNRGDLNTIQGDVAQMRTPRAQLETDNKAKNVQASQQDQKSISLMYDQIATAINADTPSQ